MDRVFQKDGYLSNMIPSYEYRNEQYVMADFILEQLYEAKNAIIEAGTGTGKTLAYLIPSILYCLKNNRKLAVSTETKTLQKQLVDKDIPIVKEIFNNYFNMDFSYSLCLGSSNYPCRMRFEAILQSGRIHARDLKKIKQVNSLFNSNKIFTNFDVKLPGFLWNEIRREGDSCNAYKCRFAAICAYQMARKEWSQSHLLVMNHYLFFSNIAAGKSYLPKCDLVIFDEAHSIEDIAASQIGFKLGYGDLLEIFNRFVGDKKQHLLAGIIRNDALRSRCLQSIQEIVKAINSFFADIRKLIPAEKNYIRIREPIPFGNSLVDMLKEYMTLMAEAGDGIDDDNPLRIEFDIARGKLFAYLENLALFMYQHNANYVYWIEREPETLHGDLYLRGQPVDVSEVFNREVVRCYDSSMLVSATLAIDGDFTYIIKRLGIENHKTLLLESSFDYKAQVVLYVAKDIADPGNDEYNEQASTVAAEIISKLKGNCLMLFTSYKTLRDVRNIIGKLIDFTIYSQDLLVATDAVDRYMKDNNTVLMGTHSFWQGLDLYGDLVRGVIMMKLPFSVPESPPVEAKMERLSAAGENPFYGYQIPEAVIRFKQGFGRLIRSSTDRGIVAILDTRIVKKQYGKFFLNSIPECNIVYSLQELMDAYFF